jgi:hypothetical protein
MPLQVVHAGYLPGARHRHVRRQLAGRLVRRGGHFARLLAGFGLILLLLTNRSETVRGLTVGRDERFAQLDLRTTALAGLVVLLAAFVGWLVATAHGQNGNPYGWLLAIGGLTYLLAFAFFRWRG